MFDLWVYFIYPRLHKTFLAERPGKGEILVLGLVPGFHPGTL